MQNLFNPHPYSTQVGILTERATDSGQNTDDWSLILEICDTINETDEGPKEAVRAIRKRISSSAGKDHVAIWRTLILLEACIKNCGRRLHSQIANKEFLHDFIKLLSPKNEPSQQMQTKILSMIKLWVDSSWDVPGRRDLEKVYTSLRQRGIQFPTHPVSNEVFQRQTNSGEPIDGRPISTLPHSSKSRDARKSSSLMAQTSVCRPGSDMHLDPRLRAGDAPPPPVPPPLCHACHTHHPPPTVNPILTPTSGLQSGSLVVVRNVTGSTHTTPPVQSIHPPPVYARVNGSTGLDQPISVDHRPNSHSRQTVSERRSNCCSTHVPADRMEFDLDGTVRHLTSSQRVRLTQDLSVVETNVNVLNDMLAELRPDCVTPEDVNLLQELYQTCRAMHRRVVEFLSQVSDEEATPCLLQVNDNLTNAFSRYERFERYRMRALRSEMMSETAALDLASVRFGSGHSHSVNDTRLAIEHHPHTTPQVPMLAITAGRTSFDRSDDGANGRRTTSCSNRSVTNGRLHHENRNPRNEQVDADDDDDDSLIDISGVSSRPTHSATTEEVDQWLRRDRQLVPVAAHPTRNCHQPQPRNNYCSATLGHCAHRVALEQATNRMNALALVPVSQTPQIRPTPSQPPCNTHKRSGPVAESCRRQGPVNSEDLVQF